MSSVGGASGAASSAVRAGGRKGFGSQGPRTKRAQPHQPEKNDDNSWHDVGVTLICHLECFMFLTMTHGCFRAENDRIL